MPLRSSSFLRRVDHRLSRSPSVYCSQSVSTFVNYRHWRYFTFFLSGAGTGAGFGTGEAGPLPCLSYSHISIIDSSDSPKSALSNLVTLSGSRKKSAWILSESVRVVAGRYGLACCGFLTLTFREHITCPKEAQRRLNSFISNVINDRYLTYLGVFERQKSGRIHYHFLVALRDDIRSGFDFAAIANQDYRSANSALRAEWAFLRKPRRPMVSDALSYFPSGHRLKRSRSMLANILPRISTFVAMIRIKASVLSGTRELRGPVRVIFSFTDRRDWRRKVAMFAAIVQANHPESIISGISDLSRVVGPRWAHNNREFISTL